ncbi:bax inhibitor 1-like [Mya arenaria]|uniref:bax inhibitor 1-like n=1 Tax=Mya arenaria TaxID=6604 RepID=UPI0022E750F8|nr:bax inhibitor 1-like [Mya arenaria]
MATRNGFFSEAIFKFDHLERGVQEHLKRVYGTLAISMLSAAAGAYVHVVMGLISGGLLTTLGALGMMIWLAATHHSKANVPKRLGIFVGFTFFMGVSLGPLLDMVIKIDPSIVMTALMGTSLIFVSFSLAALYNTNRTFLYMGGFLLSALSWMCLAGFMNIFFRSQLIWNLNLYGGLLVFCGFVLYDTQLIVEKKRSGDDDYIWQSVDLFLDFINIFRRLMIILASKEEGKKKRRD